MDNLVEISKQANALFRESFSECCRIRDSVPVAAQKETDESRRLAIAKKNLMDSAQLAGQIIKALDGGSTLLALIGLRSLIESLINTKYTFDHPKHQGDLKWSEKVCNDYFSRTNDPEAMKSSLNDKVIEARAKSIGLEDLFTKSFIGLCNYTHMLGHTAILNAPEKFEDFTRNGYVSTLTTLQDIRDCIQTHLSIKGWDKHKERIEAFSKKYFSPN